MKFSRLSLLAIGLSMMVMSLMVTSVFAISPAEKSPTEPRTHRKPAHLSSESIDIAGFHSDRGGALSLPQGDFFADARLAISSQASAPCCSVTMRLMASLIMPYMASSPYLTLLRWRFSDGMTGVCTEREPHRTRADRTRADRN